MLVLANIIILYLYIYCKMITTIKLVSLCHHIESQKFFHMMRTFKIYSFSNLQIYNMVLLNIVTMLSITSSDLLIA